ncbi:MAG: hypothetical protein FWC28_00815, partial [Proteobacteria bacterium]|nr:hypothetical protein [Cystobacterineae bacterium]MCL2313784.1 hypothetical protein [Pseudomonadota bacterium]
MCQFRFMVSFFILYLRPSWVVLTFFSLVAWGQGVGWLVSPPGGATGQRAMSGAALVVGKGAMALAANPAEVASLRGLMLFASGDFSLAKVRPATSTRFFARPQLSAAWRLPEGFALGFAYGRGELFAKAADSEEGAVQHIPLHRLLFNVAWALTPEFRIGAEFQLATTESVSFAVGGGRWRG